MSLRIGGDVATIVEGDEDQLEQTFTHVIENAVKFTPVAGCVDVEVMAARRLNGSPSVTIDITDTGMGIPADDIPHVFERFFRATNAQVQAVREQVWGSPSSAKSFARIEETSPYRPFSARERLCASNSPRGKARPCRTGAKSPRCRLVKITLISCILAETEGSESGPDEAARSGRRVQLDVARFLDDSRGGSSTPAGIQLFADLRTSHCPEGE
ncbi:ATP-binding protein [Microbacterium sp. BR1]|uniref:ATP-binding protein n=1 Tax=Microbacterium sp. BR1 TaxID=1070896 RepID=UPI0015E1A779|nr:MULTISPECIES: HAMP domain-containing sensor histidine kinase [unclassified Microbacterium]